MSLIRSMPGGSWGDKIDYATITTKTIMIKNDTF